ncbi:alpha/beta fold hydrolase [Actinomycetospora chiangmaiensis]|uniref:alpha/beta fold hydrolase n=1 Tax=Actinomycetospora chiangmaiensis TaxID=402650 RepID=UPI000376E063|nr:alpha/beta hydrolase [Actinomycetospora chiangmaiensis]
MTVLDHHTLDLTDARLHVVDAGTGSTILLVHGFPETAATFAAVIPLLDAHHRVLAVDLPGFGDSEAHTDFDSAAHARTLAEAIVALDAGSVHLVGQDVSGALSHRLAVTRPDLVASWTAVETVLPGYGFEVLAGAAWYIGMLSSPGAPELLLPGRERAFLLDHVVTPQTLRPPDPTLLGEIVDAYTGHEGFAGAAALYRSLLSEGPDLRVLAATALTVPVRTISSTGGDVVPTSIRGVAPDLTHVTVAGAGHYLALEAPEEYAAQVLAFIDGLPGADLAATQAQPRAAAT